MDKIEVPLGMNVVVPTAATLKKYGLDEQQWLTILKAEGWVCPICKKLPSTGRFVVDHDHVKGFVKMPPDQKRLYVRGVTDWFCNHSYLGRAITVEKSRNVTAYLEAYEARKPNL